MIPGRRTVTADYYSNVYDNINGTTTLQPQGQSTDAPDKGGDQEGGGGGGVAEEGPRPTVPSPCDTFTGGGCGCVFDMPLTFEPTGWCWSYEKFPTGADGAWCYTQVLGETGPNKNWQRCSKNADCDARMTCGSASRYTGTGERTAEDQLTPVQIANRPTVPTPCTGNCGCLNGWCWSYDKFPPQIGAKWCWTQALEESNPNKNWQRCMETADCDERMTCGSSSRYTGSTTIRSAEDVLPDSILTPMERIVDPGVDAAGIAVPFSLADPKMKQMIVDVTNEIRRLVKGANLLEVEYDDNLALAAQAWVDTCKGGHGFIPGIGQNGIKSKSPLISGIIKDYFLSWQLM
ncbi:hypothetical protein BV898_08194 [Hypsibius exemplaris]|uniref:SCP domain-containing protein n=1 Tax=Hypsibius exemplaris TaxID=2072580 RepID=A0A1W0WRD8_HYPEX|nr:hypothetical protein BV898_08194 [Hypsibius exemplaris]